VTGRIWPRIAGVNIDDDPRVRRTFVE